MPSSTMTEGPAEELADDRPDDRAYRWTVRVLYTSLLAAELWFLFDWWRDTPGGQLALERWRAKLEALKAKAAECEGCARRRQRLQAAMNRMHWQAERILEGDDVPTEPEGEP